MFVHSQIARRVWGTTTAITQKYAESMPKGFPTTMLVADETYAKPLEKSTFGIPTAAGDMYPSTAD